jgi:superfamily II DNA or RNA helicase
MAIEKKSVILFIPKYLHQGFDFISFITVVKTPSYIDFETFTLEELRKKMPFLDDEALKSIKQLSNQAIFKYSDARAKEYKKVQSGKDIEALLNKKKIRYLNDCFLEGLPHWNQIPWYHQVKDPLTNKTTKAPCRFVYEKVVLKFKVEYAEALGLDLITYVMIKDQQYYLADFVRSLFLIEHKNLYFVLQPQDYAVLDWLDDLKLNQWAFRPKDFLFNVVRKLEEKGYAMDRNHCFAVQEIKSQPESMVLVNEISNTFLQFIPCWNYEGITVEGSWTPKIELQRQDEMYLVHRNKEAEQHLTQSIQDRHPSFKQQFNGNFFIHFDEAKRNNWFFKLYQDWIDQGVQLLGLDLLEHFRYSKEKAETKIEWVKSEGGMTSFTMEVRFGKEKIKIKELQKVVQAGQKSILLKDSSIGVLTDDWLSTYALMLKHAKITGTQLEVSNWLLQSNQQVFAQQDSNRVIPEAWQQKWRDWQNIEHKVFEVPETVQAKLRPYQQKGFEWMALLSEIESGACLADDMGLGKTLQTISFLSWLYAANKEYRFLIVCPSSLIYNWKSEFEKFAPHLMTRIFKGGVNELAHFYSSGDQVLIAGYGIVRTQIELLSNNVWGGVVVDESHNIKNPAAQITKAIHSLNARHRIALSGTPVMNNTFDLYAQLEFVAPGLLGSAEFFRKEYANPIDKDGNQEKIRTLSRITAPFILRRTKKQVATDLPEKTESIIWCDMEDVQHAAYEEVRTSIRNSVFLNIKNDGLAKSKMGILAGITKLKQICCSPLLLDEYADKKTSSIKLNVLMEELQSLMLESKALVFSQFKGMLHLIANELKHKGIPFYHFDGDTDIADRRDMVNAFQHDEDEAKVFLISLKAGNTGLNLTAADYVFLIDPWWNSAVENQAIDRTHRIGQTKHVFAYKMICKNTIEEKIIQLQKRKGDISDELVHAEDGFVKNLSEEDVEYLFS